MKIILGICGFGFGHSVRQRPILEGLLSRGHSVILITNDSSYHFYTTHYPQVTNARVYVPVMHTTPRGLDFAATASDPRNEQPGANAAFWRACGLIERHFGKPDVVISDYDMVSAQIAYLFDAPLVTLDQQSKFLGYDFPEVGGYTPDEHRMRLGYFFPKAQARFATSFFKVNYRAREDYPVTVIPPIIGKDVRQQVAEPRDKQVTVYISNASSIRQPFAELVEVWRQFPDYQFTCFTDAAGLKTPPHIRLLPTNRPAFINSLRQSAAVIATAGHNLITEALYLNVPLFLLPFDHYEQQLNASVAAEEQAGMSASHVTVDTMSDFLARLEHYRHHQRTSERLYNRFDGDEIFLALVEAVCLHREANP